MYKELVKKKNNIKLLSRNLQQESMQWNISRPESKQPPTKIAVSSKVMFKTDREIRTFQDKHKQK